MIVYYISIPPIARIVGYDIDKYNTGCVFKEASSIGQFCICFKLVQHKLEVSFRFYMWLYNERQFILLKLDEFM